ncbi:MAG: PstS family phosphate ABC transporter substrate-binding protein [Oceanipulchritudo sp.]
MSSNHLKLAQILLAVTAFCLGASGLSISGSDLLDAGIEDALRAELEAAGLEAALSFKGSLLGQKELEQGDADAAILAFPEDLPDSLPGRRFPFAFQMVAFAVHASNPVPDLTYAMLASLYGQSGVLESWSNLTAQPEWRDRKISLWASRREDAINLEIFNAVVLQGSPLKRAVRYSTGDAAQLISIVVEDASALVLVPAIPANAAVRFLAVKAEEEGRGYTPTPDNVFFGDYPLRLPFYLVVSDRLDEATLAKLLRAIYSPAVTGALQNAYYMPMPDTERRSILAQFE